MKSFKQYLLKEEFNTYRCKNLEVVFDVVYNETNQICFKIPSMYSEDNFQIYLQDLYLDKLPGQSFKTKDTLKNNLSNLFDTHFEYESYEKTEEEPSDFIDWKDSYDDQINSKTEFGYVVLTNCVYIMDFDSFDMQSESENDINNDLYVIFNSMSIQNDDNIPFDIILNKDKINYE